MPRISELPLESSGPLNGDELVPIVQGGDTVQTTTQAIANLAPDQPDAVTSVNGETGTVVLDAADVGATIDPSLLSTVSNLSGAEILTVEQGGNPVQVTTQQIASLGVAGGGVTSVNGDAGPAVVLDAADVGALADPSGLPGVSGLTGAEVTTVEQGGVQVQVTVQQIVEIARPQESLVVACSDETTALTAGVAKVTFHMPYNFYVDEVFAGLTTVQTSGSTFTVDINDGAASILSTKITIDNTEETSLTAATPPVISDQTLLKGAKITVDIDAIGNGTAKGLKAYIIGRRLT